MLNLIFTHHFFCYRVAYDSGLIDSYWFTWLLINISLSCKAKTWRHFKLRLFNAEARRNKLSAGQLYSDMMKLQLEASRASTFCQTWKKNNSLVKDEKDVIPTKRLVDIDWKFGVTASSDSLARVGNCYLQVLFLHRNLTFN